MNRHLDGPSKVGRGGTGGSFGRLRVLLCLAVALSLATGGCLGVGGDRPDTSVEGSETGEETALANESGATWTLDADLRVTFLAGAGVPYNEVVVAGSQTECESDEAAEPTGFVGARLPANASHLEITLGGDTVNASQPGAGYATFMYRKAGGTWHDPDGEPREEDPWIYQEPPRERVQANVSQPEAGAWEVWVWPHGVTVNQSFDLHLAATGQGPPSGDLADVDGYGLTC